MAPSIAITARYENLEKIGHFVNEIAQTAGFDETRLYEIQIAVDEACSNIIDHAYEGECDEVIHCTCTVSAVDLTIEFEDHGCEFDPSKIPAPDLTSALENRDEHGLGLYLMYHYMDEIRFTFSKEKGNHLIMIKYRSQQQ